MLIAIFIWILCGVVASLVGANKGMGCFGFAAGFLLGPFGLFIIFFMPGDRAECPYCKKHIHKEASACPHCQREQPVEKQPEQQTINKAFTRDARFEK